MANIKGKTASRAKSTADVVKTEPNEPAVEIITGDISEKTEDTAENKTTAVAEKTEEYKAMIPKTPDLAQKVTVRNGFHGRLVYKSKRTGESFVWEGFNDEQEIELLELKNAKGSNKKYFINNWFMFDDLEVVEYLGVGKYYKSALKIDEFDKLFEKAISDIKTTIASLSDGQKRSVAYRAKQLVAAGEIDSNKTIVALEEALGVELIER